MIEAAKTRRKDLEVSFPAMLCWIAATGVLTWLAGAWPTWRLAGTGGLATQGIAAGLVLAVMAGNAAAVKHYAALGPRKTAFAFMFLGILRIVVCMVLATVVWAVSALPTLLWFAWVWLFYVVMLLAEGFCLGRALKRDAFLVALGERRSPRRRLPSDGRSEMESGIADRQSQPD